MPRRGLTHLARGRVRSGDERSAGSTSRTEAAEIIGNATTRRCGEGAPAGHVVPYDGSKSDQRYQSHAERISMVRNCAARSRRASRTRGMGDAATRTAVGVIANPALTRGIPKTAEDMLVQRIDPPMTPSTNDVTVRRERTTAERLVGRRLGRRRDRHADQHHRSARFREGRKESRSSPTQLLP